MSRCSGYARHVAIVEKKLEAVSSTDETFQTDRVDSNVDRGKAHFVIVGGGPVGTRAAQELARLSDKRILQFSDESWGPYNRVKLTPLLAREVNLGQVRQPFDTMTAARVERMDARRITAIDPAEHIVEDHTGEAWRYEKLILATGSRPHRPLLPGVELSGVYTFRNLNDAQALIARVHRSRKAVVIGGGLLGLEAARGLHGHGLDVTVVEHEAHLMARQLDRAGGDLLRAEIEALGMGVKTATAAREIVGPGRVEALELSNGEIIPCDTIVICTGVRSNMEIARDAGIDVGRAIRVDAEMRTSVPDVFAIGECAEHDGHVEGLVAPGYEQAKVAAIVSSGGVATYQRRQPTTKLKLIGAAVFSAGDIEQIDQRSDVRTHSYASNGERAGHPAVYRRLVVSKGRLVGAIAVGVWDEVGRIQDLIAREARVWPWQLRRFRRVGDVLGDAPPDNVINWPAASTVCNCTGVTRGQLGQAIAGGCATIDALANMTSASTVCGTCRPLLLDLLGSDSAPEPAKWWRVVAVVSLAALLGSILFYGLPRLPAPEMFSVGFAFSKLFVEGALKQISGFTLLGLAVLAAILSLRKRIKWLNFGNFAGWRLVHTGIGLVALATLVAHTGFRLGEQLNFALIVAFLSTLVAGAVGGGIIAFEHRLVAIPAIRQRRIDPRKIALWLHIIACWPLPLLLVLHIMTVYFY